ncbi:hypothetical protein FGG08_007318 [Glutinoglossum americanum]|uniref:Uncharacterized protein n=1 Tax=Glutinoglossum americanum TaxID=1670608 RepID=A0A9P8HUH8_9PEZI|nr:hypothetical protein FGG08_007318 [Glutinoglossum americanum]
MTVANASKTASVLGAAGVKAGAILKEPVMEGVQEGGRLPQPDRVSSRALINILVVASVTAAYVSEAARVLGAAGVKAGAILEGAGHGRSVGRRPSHLGEAV